MTNLKYSIQGIFPIPIYRTHRELDLDSSEKKDIEDIIEEGIYFSASHSFSNNSYIFNTKLKKIKEFCEQYIKIYVKEIIKPKEELDFYITQSWLNVTKPNESHHQHYHSNSIISGVFYIETDINQKLNFHDPNAKMIQINASDVLSFDVNKNILILFPSWLDHSVKPNEKQTKNVISISFNTFVRGNLGQQGRLNQLIL